MAINTELPIKTVLVDGQEIPIVAGSPKFAELVDGTITSLETSDLADVTTIRDGAFEGLTSLTSVAIPSNVTTIGASAFSGCSGITTLTLAEGVTTIGASAFNGISASEINMPSTLTSVGESAFANNTVLSEVTIPDTLTSLSAGMFSGCTNLINVTMEATTPPSVTDTTFPDSVTAIYVIYGAYDDYVAQWTAYADKIVRLPAIPSTITITVNNYLGEMVSGASVTISGNGQTYAGTTDSVGVFTQGDLQPATYTITVADIDGFKTPASQEVVVEEDTQNSVTVTYLEIPAVNPIFGENTPEQIAEISAIISANNMTAEQVEATYGWKIGDTIERTMSDGYTLVAFISDFNHDILSSDHVTKAGITLEMRDCWHTEFDPYNHTNHNSGGYASSILRLRVSLKLSYINNAFNGLLKAVDKVSSNGGGTNYTGVDTTSETIFPLSLVELTGSTDAAGGELEGYQYAYWKDKDSYFKNWVSNPSASKDYWLRSVPEDSTTQAYRVRAYDGLPKAANASATYTYSSFAFCI